MLLDSAISVSLASNAENASVELVKNLDEIIKKPEVFYRFEDYESLLTAQFEKRISKTIDHGREYCAKEQGAYYKRIQRCCDEISLFMWCLLIRAS